jgi:hypothetical protein
MKRLFFISALLLILIVPSAWAISSQYPDPNRQTIWNNITDSVHTLGKSPAQANQIKRRLHNVRKQARIHSINVARSKAWMNGSN